MELLLSLDTQLFLSINGMAHPVLLDILALALSGAGTLGFVWFLLAGILFFREEKRHHWFFLPILTAGALSGAIVNLILKPLVARMRPSELIGAIVVEESLIRDYGFPSGHATMSFAAAVVLSRVKPKWRPALYLLAFLISLSRIYLGKHYPLDVLMGALLGWGIGHGSLYATQRKTATHH